MAVLIVICVALLSLIGPPLLNLVYGQKVEGYFTNVLISTSALALLYYLSDILVLCRDIKGALISAAAALIITLGTMIPLEAAFDMQGINYVVIIASLAGAILFCSSAFSATRALQPRAAAAESRLPSRFFQSGRLPLVSMICCARSGGPSGAYSRHQASDSADSAAHRDCDHQHRCNRAAQ